MPGWSTCSSASEPLTAEVRVDSTADLMDLWVWMRYCSTSFFARTGENARVTPELSNGRIRTPVVKWQGVGMSARGARANRNRTG